MEQKDFNILDKSDKSKTVVYGNVGKSPKSQRYDWKAIEGGMGVFRLINKNKLKIDSRYQRDASDQKVMKIVKFFDWKKFGVLSVSERPDGFFWIIEGGHRARAAFYRDEIKELPCLVFEMENLAEEAEVFFGMNTFRTNVAAYNKFTAQLTYGDKDALTVQAILNKHGYELTRHSTNKPGSIQAIGTMMQLVKRDSELFDRVFDLAKKISANNAIPAYLLRGIFCLAIKMLQKNIDIFENGYKEKLLSYNLDAIHMTINSEKLIKKSGGELVEASALLSIINENKKKKIKFD